MVFERVVSTPNPPMSHEVLYIGSAVPLETSVGLEAVQQPLRARYPVDNDETIQGVLATVLIVPEGIQLRFQGENSPPILFLFSSLSMCAAVRCVKVTDPNNGVVTPRFVPLASPQAGGANSSKPAIFTAITRRTKGRQVLECHGFVTNTPKDALDLVQWTCSMDRRSKSAGVSPASPSGGHNYSSSTIGGPVTSPSAQRFDGDVSFRASDTFSLPDFPIQIRPSDNLNGAPIGALPEHSSKEGYFYSTKNTQVKRYSLQRFHGSTGVDDTPSVIGAGADQFMRRPASAYAASQVSAPAAHHHHHHLHAGQQHHHLHREHHEPVLHPPPPPPGMIYPMGVRPGPPPPPMMVPVRGRRPAMMRPVYVLPPPPQYATHRHPRFFSPPPSGMPARPVPMYLVPPGEMPATLPRPVRKGRRGTRGSSHSSTDHSSSPSPARLNGKANINGGKKNPTQERGVSSDGSSSRPQTPPTDYEGAPRGPRVSRRDDFMLREQNGFATLPPPGAGGMYMMSPYSFYPPPPGAYERARSQPPLDRKSKKKDKKSKKSSKKLARKSSAKNGHERHPHDMYESTDSVGGYQSEMLTGSKANAENRKPRDFLREENQFQHERAFSKSLAEEARKSARGEAGMNNAYSLTDLGHRDIEIAPGAGQGTRPDGFQTLY